MSGTRRRIIRRRRRGGIGGFLRAVDEEVGRFEREAWAGGPTPAGILRRCAHRAGGRPTQRPLAVQVEGLPELPWPGRLRRFHSSAGPVASLGGTATLRGYRRQGVQLALLRARIRLAAEAGCDLVVVTADPGSTSGRNARRAGFHLAYTNVRLASPLR